MLEPAREDAKDFCGGGRRVSALLSGLLGRKAGWIFESSGEIGGFSGQARGDGGRALMTVPENARNFGLGGCEKCLVA